jgi:phage shock protein A
MNIRHQEVVMGILSRAIRLCKADLHGVMDQMEDKELLLKQHLREMQAVIAGRQARIDQLEDAMGMAQRDLTRYNKQIQALEEDLDLAVARDKDDIARMLIRKRYPMRQCIANMETRLKNLTAELAEEQQRLAAQTMSYDDIRHRVAAVREHSLKTKGMSGGVSIKDAPGPSEPSDEEIEWELFQRKEAAGSGRTP